MPQSDAKRPTLWIIAGPNGSGKSSAYGMSAVDEPLGAVWIINPDLLAARIRDQELLEGWPANLEAVKRIEAWLYASVEAHQTVGVETVLSTGKYRALVEQARVRGFALKLIYVYLDSVEINIERVAIRVEKGGHAVPEDRIISRRTKSLDQLPWFLEAADFAEIYDNSGAKPRLVFSKSPLDMVAYGRMIPEVVQAIDGISPGFASDYAEAF